MTTVLVTGATGTIGSRVVRELAGRGASVRAFVRDARRARATLGDGVEFAVGDFADPGSVREAMAGAHAVFLSSPNHPCQVEYETAVIDAAAATRVARVVKLSAAGAESGSPLAFWDAHGRIEQHLWRSTSTAVVLRPSFYMANVLASADPIRHAGKLFAPAAMPEWFARNLVVLFGLLRQGGGERDHRYRTPRDGTRAAVVRAVRGRPRGGLSG